MGGSSNAVAKRAPAVKGKVKQPFPSGKIAGRDLVAPTRQGQPQARQCASQRPSVPNGEEQGPVPRSSSSSSSKPMHFYMEGGEQRNDVFPQSKYNWDEWEVSPVSGPEEDNSLKKVCFTTESLGINLAHGPGDVFYIESIVPGSWADREKLEALVPCKIRTVNKQNPQGWPLNVLKRHMAARPLWLSLRKLRKVQPGSPAWRQKVLPHCSEPPRVLEPPCPMPSTHCNEQAEDSTQPCLAIVVYRRRLRGKQPRPEARTSVQFVRGYYDVLRIQRSASAVEINAAYRRQALITHPDKGGNPDDFRRVNAAYEALSDPKTRALYDRGLDMFSRRDGSGSEFVDEAAEETDENSACGEEAQSCIGAACATRAKLLSTSPKEWARWLGTCQTVGLRALRGLLEGKKSLLLLPPDDSLQGSGVGTLKGLTSSRNGYKVEVAWECRQSALLCISTGFTRSMKQAINWHIVLQGMRGNAVAKMQRNRALDPLLQEDFLDALRNEPSLEITFTITVRAGGKKISSPAVHDLGLVMDFRRRFLEVVQARRPQSVLDDARRRAAEEAIKSKEELARLRKRLLHAVIDELVARKRAAEPVAAEDQLVKRMRLDSGSVDDEASRSAELTITPEKAPAPVPKLSSQKLGKEAEKCGEESSQHAEPAGQKRKLRSEEGCAGVAATAKQVDEDKAKLIAAAAMRTRDAAELRAREAAEAAALSRRAQKVIQQRFQEAQEIRREDERRASRAKFRMLRSGKARDLSEFDEIDFCWPSPPRGRLMWEDE